MNKLEELSKETYFVADAVEDDTCLEPTCTVFLEQGEKKMYQKVLESEVQ